MDGIPVALAGYDPAAVRRAAAMVAGTRWDALAGGDAMFGLWLKIVDTELRALGARYRGGPGAPYRDWYDLGADPREAAAMIGPRPTSVVY